MLFLCSSSKKNLKPLHLTIDKLIAIFPFIVFIRIPIKIDFKINISLKKKCFKHDHINGKNLGSHFSGK